MKKQCKILLAGYGDVASRTVTALLQMGAEVSGLRRSVGHNLDQRVSLLRGDMGDHEVLLKVMKQSFDVVVISVTPDEFSDQGYINSYIKAARCFAEVVAELAEPPGLVIWVSSTSVYGKGQGQWVDETSPVNPGSFSGRRLLEAETVIAEIAKQASIKSVVVRFSGIYGPGRERLITQVKQGKYIAAEPLVWSNRIHSEDCAAVLVHLIKRYLGDQPLDPLYLGTDSKPSTLHEVYDWLGQQLGVEGKELIANSGRANRRCSNQRLLATGYEFIYPTYRDGYRQELLKSNL